LRRPGMGDFLSALTSFAGKGNGTEKSPSA
jgi:hypothetical protein